ncbi:MAG: molybdopterin-binding protein [Desulfovibrionaceae bacterium]|nr:molybdopterin-binding protein [Desulfovibrionaceae bacterium]
MRFAMKTIAVEEAVGTILCQDITRIVPGEFKGPVFRKGHVVTEEDIPVLLDVGKEHLYVYEPQPGMVHENDAAWRIVRCAVGGNLHCSDPKEGRINITAECDGLFCVDEDLLFTLNSLGEITMATQRGNIRVRKGESVAATRVTPLVIEEAALAAMEAAVQRPILQVLPFAQPAIGIVTTGSEVEKGRIKDGFGPVLRARFEDLGCPVHGQAFTGDDAERTAEAIRKFAAEGCGMICVTGGMSVDPDDRTPLAIRLSGAEIICYGSPVYPGAMFMLAYLQGPQGPVPVLGLPGGVMFSSNSVFDVVVPRLLAGQRLEKADICRLGCGGLLKQ